MLLSVIGGKTYALLSNLLAPEKPAEKSFPELQEVLQVYFEPKLLVIAERFHFHWWNETVGESIAEYVAELQRLATHCKFEPYLSEALRDRLVCGIRSEGTQKRLLAEAKLDLTKAIEFALSSETAENSQQLKGPEQLCVWQVAQASGVSKACNCCGSNHKERDCHHRDTVCHTCGKKGHLANICHSVRQPAFKQTSSRGRGGYRGKGNTKRVESTECDDSSAPILVVCGQQSPPLTVNLQLNGVPVTMEVDTGVTVLLMSEESQRHFFPEVVFKRSTVRLTTYNMEAIAVVGTMTVQVEYLGYVGSHTLYVVQETGPTLLG